MPFIRFTQHVCGAYDLAAVDSHLVGTGLTGALLHGRLLKSHLTPSARSFKLKNVAPVDNRSSTPHPYTV